ncbi:MAG: hypothetical protein WC499_04315 [Patescibacteria group bacterium]
MLETKWAYPQMDEWQKEVLEYQGNLVLMCGRQVGKSEIMAKKIAEYLLNNPKKKLMIISGVERQASGLYNKVLGYLEQSQPRELKRGKDKPLRTHLKLKNGSELLTEPVGLDGSGARQHTLHGVVFEEMQLIPEDAFGAITPMLLTTGGFMWMLGTAWSTEGYVYERLSDPDFKVFRINSEEVAELRPEPQRTIMLKHLEKERERLGEAMYGQEYLAIPSEKIRQIFSDALIKKCQRLKRREIIIKEHRHVCGVDPAGLGEDEGAITILDTEDKEKIIQTEFIITNKLMTTQTTDKIIELDKRYDFEKIYVDDGGVGFGVFSELLRDDSTRGKTEALNNSQRSLTRDESRKTKILKEDLYINLLRLMERGKIKLLDDAEIRESLKSCKFEYHETTKKMLITSNYNHPVESLIRSAWDAESKDLNLKIYSIKV